MATLFNTKIKDTYQSLLKLEDNTILTTTSKNITDGLGNASPLYMSTTQVRIGSTSASALYWDNVNNRLGVGTNAPTAQLNVVTPYSALNTDFVFSNSDTTNAPALLSYSSFTSTLRLSKAYSSVKVTNFGGNADVAIFGSGGPAGFLQLNQNGGSSNVSLSGEAAGYSYFLTNVGFGLSTTPTAKLQVRGSGSTSATTSLLVQNSSGTNSISVKDDGIVTFHKGTYLDALSVNTFHSIDTGDAVYGGIALRNNTQNYTGYIQTGRSGNSNSIVFLHTTYGGASSGAYNQRFSSTSVELGYPSSPNIITLHGNAVFNISDTPTLYVNGATNTTNTGAKLAFQCGTVDTGGATDSGGIIVFKTNVGTPNNINTRMVFYNRENTTLVERMRIADSGNLLLGTTTDNGFKVNVNGSVNIAGGSVLNFANSSTQCWITTAGGGTGLGTRSLNLPGTGGPAHWVFYNDTARGIQAIDSTGDSVVLSPGNSSTTGILSINKSTASGYGGGTFIYYQTNYSNRIYTFGNPSSERADETGVHTKIVAGAGGTVGGGTYGNGGHIYLEGGAAAFGSNSPGNILISTNITGSKVGIGEASPSAKLQVKGNGSTSATSSLLVQNSGGTNLLQVKDNGDLVVGTVASGLGTIYVPHDASYGTRGFLAIQNGGATLMSAVSNAQLLLNGSMFNAGSLYLTAINYGIVGKSAFSNNNTSIILQGDVNAYNGTNQDDASNIVLLGNTGNTLQANGSMNFLKITGSVNESGGGGAKFLCGIYYKATITGGTALDNSHYCYWATSGQMMVNTTSPQSSAQLQVDSTTRGVLFPRMTTTQKNAIASPVGGLVVYDTTTNKLCCYNGTTWNDLF